VLFRSWKKLKHLDVVVIAAGEGVRFASPKPKHLTTVGGEVILSRTLRLFVSMNPDNTYVVIPPDGLTKGFEEIPRLNSQFVFRKKPIGNNAIKFAEASNASNKKHDLLIVYGDVFFTKDAVIKIFDKIDQCLDIQFFCRYQGSGVVNSGWGEIFAIYVPAKKRAIFSRAVRKTEKLFTKGAIWRDGGWEVAKTLSNLPTLDFYRTHPRLAIYFEIDDMTDDLDFAYDRERLRKLLPDSLEEIRERHIKLIGEVGSLYDRVGEAILGLKNIPKESEAEEGWVEHPDGRRESVLPPIVHLTNRINKLISLAERLNSETGGGSVPNE
jgi:GTP:adenosylcobinamide-phosphate guanylyltransferase